MWGGGAKKRKIKISFTNTVFKEKVVSLKAWKKLVDIGSKVNVKEVNKLTAQLNCPGENSPLPVGIKQKYHI